MLRCSRPLAGRASAGVTCRDRASDAGTRSWTGDASERCVSRVYLIELPRRLRMDWRARREPQPPEMRRLWRLHGCGAWVHSHVESKSLEERSYQDADLAFLECTYDGFDVCVMVIDSTAPTLMAALRALTTSSPLPCTQTSIIPARPRAHMRASYSKTFRIMAIVSLFQSSPQL